MKGECRSREVGLWNDRKELLDSMLVTDSASESCRERCECLIWMFSMISDCSDVVIGAVTDCIV